LPAARLGLIFAVVFAVACVVAARADPVQLRPAHPAPQVVVVRRGWHIDVGFDVADLKVPLRSIASNLPMAHFIFFGFGDMHYLLSKSHNASTMAAALWPGRGIMLVTGLQGSPQQAFGADHVIELTLTDDAARELQDFIWESFATVDGVAGVYRSGPYEGSLYFLATHKYSALHTCNTWAAEALHAAHLHVHRAAVVFAGQLWRQVRRLQRQEPAPSLAPQPQTSH